jgi:CheY-like chemotaxis protein
MMLSDFPLSHPKILLVEDNDLNCDIMQRRLSRRGFVILTATTAHEAIDMAHQQSPDLILMDLQLPDLSGCDAARILRSDPQTYRIPLIALTAHAMERDRDLAIAAGCDEYETKPIDLPRLLEKMQMLLQRRSALPNDGRHLDTGSNPSASR